jgi:hypothetical protein
MSAQQSAGMAQAQLPYALGQHMMGYSNQDPYKQLALQDSYQPYNAYNPVFNRL